MTARQRRVQRRKHIQRKRRTEPAKYFRTRDGKRWMLLREVKS